MVKNIREVKAAMKKKAKLSKTAIAKKVVANVKSNSQFISKTEKAANRLYGIFEIPSKTFVDGELKTVAASLNKMCGSVNKRYAKTLNDLNTAISLNLPNSKLISQIEDFTGLHSKLAMLKVQADASLAEEGETLSIDSTGFVVDTAEEQASEDTATEDVASEETVAEDVEAGEETVAEDVEAGEETVAEDVEAGEETVAEDVEAGEETVAEDVDTISEEMDEILEEEDPESDVKGEDEILEDDELEEDVGEVEELDELTEEVDEDLLPGDEDTGIEDLELEDPGIDEFVTNEILTDDEMEVLEEEPEEEEVTSSIKAKKLKTAKKTKNNASSTEDAVIAQLFEELR